MSEREFLVEVHLIVKAQHAWEAEEDGKITCADIEKRHGCRAYVADVRSDDDDG